MGVCDGPAHGGGMHDGVVAMGDAFDVHVVSGIGADSGVVSGVLAEGAFFHEFFRVAFPFQHDLRMGGDGEIHGLALNHLTGLAADGTINVILADVGRNPGSSQDKQKRIASDDGGAGHGFSHLLVFFQHLIRMFSLNELGSDFIFAQQLASVGPQVHPPGFGILGDDEMGRSDITSAVQGEEMGYRKLIEIHIVAHDDILFAGGVFFVHHLGGNRISAHIHPPAENLRKWGILRHPQDKGQFLGGGTGAGDDRGIIVLDIFKEERRPLCFLIEFGNVAQFEVPVHLGGDSLKLAFLFRQFNKISHTFHQIIPP